MKLFPLLLLVCLRVLCPAADLAETYAIQGKLLLEQFESAPFPHPKRADGHHYKDQFFSAKEHYSDPTVAIFIPKGFRETGRIDFVVHFHGWRNNVAGVLSRYKLVEQLIESGRNVVLVVPQGPRDAPDSFGGKLEDPDGFKRFMNEVGDTLRRKSVLQRTNFSTGNIILSGHSGGYQVISSILDHGGLTQSIAEVWLFDALYGQTERFLAWQERKQGRLLNIYTKDGGTKAETERMIATLKNRGTSFLTAKESELKLPDDLPSKGPIFLFTELEHDEVLEKHQTFRDFLKTSPGLNPKSE